MSITYSTIIQLTIKRVLSKLQLKVKNTCYNTSSQSENKQFKQRISKYFSRFDYHHQFARGGNTSDDVSTNNNNKGISLRKD